MCINDLYKKYTNDSSVTKGDENLDKKGWVGIILEFILLNYFLLILFLKRYKHEDWGTH